MNRRIQVLLSARPLPASPATSLKKILGQTPRVLSSGRQPPAFYEAMWHALPLGQWVLETACHQLSVWATQPGLAHLTLAVNVSARQFHEPDFVAQMLVTIALTGANPHRLKLELTESLLVSDVEGIIAKMNLLKAQGIGFSLDDFGTGYSSLSYLKRLPLDQLKIDQGFVRDMLQNPNDAAIARMVALGASLKLAVIAEGVETQAQRDFLASQGCHTYQGYLFGRPVAVAKFEAQAVASATHQIPLLAKQPK
jgi:EAL domain-containing protein (putative c-di-GMP-specific phosphodiesterase class I)